MKYIIEKLNIILIIFFFTGCVINTPYLSMVQKQKKIREPSFTSDRRYYYFTQAQLQSIRGNLDAAVDYLQQAIICDNESIFLKKELLLLYLRMNKANKGLEVVKGILQQEPDNVAALILLGKLNYDMGNLENAINAYSRVIEIDAEQEDIYLFLGNIYLKKGEITKAETLYKKLAEKFPESYAGHFFLGKIYADKGNLSKAKKEFQRTLEIEPELEIPQFELAKIFIQTGEKKKAINTYKNILEKQPDNSRALTELAYYYHRINRKKNAEELFIKLGKKSIKDISVIKTVSSIFFSEKNYNGACTVYEGMLKGAPNSDSIHYSAGLSYDLNKKYKKALLHYNKVKHESDFYEKTVFNIAFIHGKLGEIDRAIAILKKNLKEFPDSIPTILYLSSFYNEAGEFDKSVTLLKQSVEINPDYAELHFRLGLAYDKLGLKNDCIKAMQSVVRLNPQHAEGLNYLGYTYADMGENLDKAEELVKKALKLRPDDGYIMDSLGWVYFKKKIYEKALEYLIKAAELIPDDPTIQEHLGDAYSQTGDKKKALEAYKNSLLKINDNESDIQQKILNLQNNM